ncbi:pyridoxal phosphate-dependent aminotransferase [Streptomyces spectabilis]|uniref:Aminotransferase n=1 Tax=Streptomyces spectabilis TaxID=68270 RepID=A0A7W8F0F6_STRST|nr:pyridoxal phosphate-dependent aminotransferase [Streptomyces spectabilis]MBB5109705.1 aminotransferase [Streptomyces spectabilis]
MVEEARDHRTIDLALGVPVAPPHPPDVIGSACTVLRSDLHNQYANPSGNEQLRAQLARLSPTPTDPETELTVTVGATEALYLAVQAAVDPGEEVVVFEPFYDNFLSAVALAGGVPRLVPLSPPDWRYDPERLRAAFNHQTRAVIVSTPNNPTGHMIGAGEWAEIADLCQRWNAVVISDEIYSAYAFDGHCHISAAEIPALRDRSFVVGSLSKSHSVAGWRIGFLRAAPALTAAARRIHVAVCAGTAAPLQEAVARVAAAHPDFTRAGDDLLAQRDRAIEVFDHVGLRCMAPDGGCYVMADISPFTDADSEAFAGRLLRDAQVFVAPGRYFHPEGSGLGDTFVRIAFNRPSAWFDAVESRLHGLRPHTARA